MKNKIKQLLSVAMTVCMLSTVVPLNTYAADVDFGDNVSVTTETDSEVTENTDTSDISNSDVEISDDVQDEENSDAVVEEETEDPESVDEDSEDFGEEETFTSDESTDGFSDGAGSSELDSLYQIEGHKATVAMDSFYKICFVDCGRKYFSVDSLKQIIDNASAAGFNYIELAVGNDGLRLLLNDMSLTVLGQTYDSDAVKDAVRDGNTAYNKNFDGYVDGRYYPYSPSVNELTQEEMDSVISYAKKKGMGVIPLLNSPGHMDTILHAAEKLTGETCSYNKSARTIDLENETAVAFTQAIIQKYITYFASQGCAAFNMGADEYANDKYTTGSMGFGNLQSTKKYSYYIKYINKMADMIKASGMLPMAFNDGIYFKGDVNSGVVNNDIIVCYWSSGWGSYNPMSATDLAAKGFKLINTHGDYYWVLGKSDAQCSASKAADFNYKEFQGGTIDDPTGAMFCIWSDYPGAESEDNVVTKTADTIAAFGGRLPQVEKPKINITYNVNEEDGKFPVNSTAILASSDGSKITDMKSSDPEVISLTGNLSETDTNSDETIANLTADEEGYASVTATALKPGTSTVSLVLENGTDLTTELTVTADAEHPLEKNITIGVNETYVETVTGNYSEGCATVDTSIATVSADYEHTEKETISYEAEASTNGEAYQTNKVSNVIDGNLDSIYWKGKPQEAGDYVEVKFNNAIPFDTVRLTSGDGDFCTNAKVLVSADGYDWENIGSYTGSKNSTSSFTNTLSKVKCIKVELTEASEKWWKLAEIEWGNTINGNFTRMLASGTVTTEATEQTKLTFKGVAVGDTTATIGTTKYNIHVVAEDISNVSPVKVEYWITNRPVTADGATEKEIKATDGSVYSETGAKISELVPKSGTYGDAEMEFWKGTLLTSDKKQTEGKGVNQTNAGTDFDYIRYWSGNWSVSADGKNWNTVGVTDQIVAYYLQVTAVTDEVTTKVVDWGQVPYSDYQNSNFVLLDYAVKYQSGDRTPNQFPVSAKTVAYHCDPSDTTSVHQYPDGNGAKSDYYRDIGLIKADETSDYEIYMITVTASSDERTKALVNYNYDYDYVVKSISSYEYEGEEKVIWVDDEKNLGDFVDHKADGYHVGGDATVPGLSITNRHAMLVTYYVRAKVNNDSLKVHYVDKTTNTEFYNYSITVAANTKFDEYIALPANNNKIGDLVNGSVENSLGKVQTVSSDLSTMPEIGSAYRFSNYTCESLELSENQKEVTIYYTFNNTYSFVADYGRPLVIKAGDLGLGSATWISSSASTMKYGNVELNKNAHTLTYTPTEILPEPETINLTLEEYVDENQTKTAKATYIIYIYPATTVNYEEGFATYEGEWTNTGSTDTEKTQRLAELGSDENNYGYDGSYASDSEASNGTQTVSETKGDAASFFFTGTGVDIYANTTKNSGYLTIKIADASDPDNVSKLALVDTKMSGEYKGSDDGYSVPVFSATDLTHDNYKVTIIHSMNNSQVNIDGFRVYNTLKDSSVYVKDEEDNPSFLEVRDLQFGALTDIENYGKDGRNVYAVGEQVYKDLTKDEAVVQAAITVNGQVNEQNQKALYEKGPKNEVYLAKGSSLTISVNTDRKVQLGLKGVDGTTRYSINHGSSNSVSTVDMFYTVKEKGDPSDKTIIITNTGDHVLSVTKLKVCDDPNAIQPLSVDSVVSALYAAGMTDPEPTVTPEPTAKPTATPTQKPAQQIKLATPKLGKVVSAGYDSLKLNWSKVKNADGYRVYVKVNGQWKALGNTSSTTYVHKKLETGKSYTYTVRAYKKTKDGTVWSSYDKKGITGKTTLNAPTLRKVKRNSTKKATLSWSKVSGANGYVVYRKTNNGRWQVVGKITKGNVTSFTDKKLSKGKKYTYTVRAYRTVGKKNVYSGYNKKGLTVK